MPHLSTVKTLNIIGANLTAGSKEALLRSIQEWSRQGNKAVVLSGNVHSYNLAKKLSWFRDFLNQADWVRLDGVGVRLGAWLLGHKTPSRITWADFAWDLAEACESHSLTLFLAGSRPGIAEKAAARLKERSPGLVIVGTHHGYFDKTPGSAENNAVIRRINAARPNILIVGLGMPVQERWLMDNWHRLDVNVALTGGAVFDYVSGELQRGPRWMTDHSLEWLARLLIEPRRLWRRYIIGNPLFLWRVIRERLGLLKYGYGKKDE